MADENGSRHQALIDLGNRQRDLGFFNDALQSYREAETIKGDMQLSLKIASTMQTQGRVPMAVHEMDKALRAYTEVTVDKELLSVAQLFHACALSYMTVRFQPALDLGLKFYEEFVRGVPIEDFNGYQVRVVNIVTCNQCSA